MNKGSIVERLCSDLDHKEPRYKSPTLLLLLLLQDPWRQSGRNQNDCGRKDFCHATSVRIAVFVMMTQLNSYWCSYTVFLATPNSRRAVEWCDGIDSDMTDCRVDIASRRWWRRCRVGRAAVSRRVINSDRRALHGVNDYAMTITCRPRRRQKLTRDTAASYHVSLINSDLQCRPRLFSYYCRVNTSPTV